MAAEAAPAADRAGAIAEAEAALTDSDLDEFARRLCLLLRDAWLRRQGELADQTREGRVAGTSATRPSGRKEQRGVSTTRHPAAILRQ